MAGHENGYSYSGDLSSKYSYRVVDSTVRRRSEAHDYARALEGKIYEEGQGNRFLREKDEPAGAIPFVKDGEVLGTRTVTKTVTLRGEDLSEDADRVVMRTTQKVASEVKLKKNEVVRKSSYSILAMTQKVYNIPTSGRKVTQYVIRDVTRKPHQQFKSVFRTQTEAKKYLTEYLKKQQTHLQSYMPTRFVPSNHSGEYEIVAEIVKEENEPLVKMVQRVTSIKLEVTVTIDTLTPTPLGQIDGWVFFGIARS